MKKILNILLVSALSLFIGLAQPVNAGIISKTIKGATIAVVVKKVAPAVIKSTAKNIVKKETKKIKSAITEELKKNELSVGKYKDLITERGPNKLSGKQTETLQAHHMPSNKYMNSNGVSKGDGIAMEMSPARHAQTRSYGNSSQNMKETGREALARDVKDAKNIYAKEGKYNKNVRNALKEVIKKNKEVYQELFNKQAK